LKLRELRREDWELLLAWRNNPILYKGFYSQAFSNSLIEWEDHVKWIESRANWKHFIIEYEGRRIGSVTIGWLDSWTPELGYYVGEIPLWGKGLGKQAVRMAMDWLKEQGYKYCHTTVIKDNERSLGLLKGLGFWIQGDARENEVWLCAVL